MKRYLIASYLPPNELRFGSLQDVHHEGFKMVGGSRLDLNSDMSIISPGTYVVGLTHKSEPTSNIQVVAIFIMT